MKYTLTLLFLYNAEVRYALQLRQLSSKIHTDMELESPALCIISLHCNASESISKNI